MITLQVNGRQVERDGPTALLRYLEELGVNLKAVAVEHNGVIIERSAYADATLHDGDVVEIVRMVGGGRQGGAPGTGLRQARRPQGGVPPKKDGRASAGPPSP